MDAQSGGTVETTQTVTVTEMSLEEQPREVTADLIIKEEGTGDDQVQVIYLNVPESDEPQVLDISNLLAQGLQVETVLDGDEQKTFHTDGTVIQIKEDPGVLTVSDQSDVQSADALLRLSKSQSHIIHDGAAPLLASTEGPIEEVEIISQDASSAEALLQLSSDPNAKTYIVDENGTMIPLESVRASGLLEDSTLALSQEYLTNDEIGEYKGKKGDTMGNRCVLCAEQFKSLKELSQHQASHHPDGMPWECSICQRRFSKKMGVKAHMRAHAISKEYKCSSCKKTFLYKTALARHMKMHSCDEPFKCTICGEVYKTQWDLRKHRLVHQPERTYRCDVCGKVFKQKQTLVIHSRIHTGQKPYSCDICDRNFSLRSTLNQHKRIHTGEKPNVCPVCGRRFRQKSTMKSHLKIHTCKKPYMCRYCKMRFAYVDEVTDHEHTHLVNKNWHCDICGMRFRNQSLLSRHSRVHSNERPFQCKICQKRFVQSGTLQSHMRSHTKEKPYHCRLCSKSYTTSGTLLVHIRKAHKVDAKKVKDVFPASRYIGDQKVFRIRNKTPTVDKSSVENAADVPDVGEESIATEIFPSNSDTEGQEANEDTHVGAEVSEEQTGQQVAEVSESTEVERSDAVVQTFHSAEDRQEAALGLAELALVAGEEMQMASNSASKKTRTFFKEEEDDENNPGMTKIILSKEGGVMNSQDPHQCPVCARIFGRKSIMVEHLRIHTNEKPYQCDFCPDAFRQNAQLRSHIRNRHTEVERYQCSFCHKKFLSPSITMRHIHFHHKLKVKFCENADPNWKVESAVWSDEKFKLKVDNPQFLHTEKSSAVKTPVKSGSRKRATIIESPHKGRQVFTVKSSDLATGAAGERMSTRSSRQANVNPDNVTKSPIKLEPVEGVPVLSENSCAVEISSETHPVAQIVPGDSDGTTIKTEDILGHEVDLEASRLHCSTCDLPFNNIDSLQSHLKEVHNATLESSNVTFINELAEDESEEFQESSVVEVSHQDSEEMDNENSSPSRASLGTHIVIYDDKEKCVDDPQNKAFACGMCLQGFQSREACEEHMKEHTEEEAASVGLHKCDTCGSVLKNTQQVGKHIQKEHGVTELYVCSICQKEFYQLSSVHRHMRFFHKWEMKIRGEESIPVLTKPAPHTMHAPSGKPKSRGKQRDSSQRSKSSRTVRVSSRNGAEVTYITLDVRDLQNLQIFQPDGRRVPFDVVSTTEWGRTLKIRYIDEDDNSTEEQGDKGKENDEKAKESGDKLSEQSETKQTANNTDINSESDNIKSSIADVKTELKVGVVDKETEGPTTVHVVTNAPLKATAGVITTSTTKRVTTLPLPACLTSSSSSTGLSSNTNIISRDRLRSNLSPVKKGDHLPHVVVKAASEEGKEISQDAIDRVCVVVTPGSNLEASAPTASNVSNITSTDSPTIGKSGGSHKAGQRVMKGQAKEEMDNGNQSELKAKEMSNISQDVVASQLSSPTKSGLRSIRKRTEINKPESKIDRDHLQLDNSETHCDFDLGKSVDVSSHEQTEEELVPLTPSQGRKVATKHKTKDSKVSPDLLPVKSTVKKTSDAKASPKSLIVKKNAKDQKQSVEDSPVTRQKQNIGGGLSPRITSDSDSKKASLRKETVEEEESNLIQTPIMSEERNITKLVEKMKAYLTADNKTPLSRKRKASMETDSAPAQTSSEFIPQASDQATSASGKKRKTSLVTPLKKEMAKPEEVVTPSLYSRSGRAIKRKKLD